MHGIYSWHQRSRWLCYRGKCLNSGTSFDAPFLETYFTCEYPTVRSIESSIADICICLCSMHRGSNPIRAWMIVIRYVPAEGIRAWIIRCNSTRQVATPPLWTLRCPRFRTNLIQHPRLPGEVLRITASNALQMSDFAFVSAPFHPPLSMWFIDLYGIRHGTKSVIIGCHSNKTFWKAAWCPKECLTNAPRTVTTIRRRYLLLVSTVP